MVIRCTAPYEPLSVVRRYAERRRQFVAEREERIRTTLERNQEVRDRAMGRRR